jgi:phenylacetate-CoA ligase
MRSPRVWRAWKWGVLARRDGYPDFRLDRMLARQERLSQTQLQLLRRDKARRLVRTCLENVPYYGDLLRDLRVGPEDLQGPEDLRALPLLTREIVTREKPRILNRSLRPDEYYPHSTGGSSGTPLEFYRGYDYDRLAVAAGNMRAWRRMGWRPGDAMVRFWMTHAAVAPGAIGSRLRAGIRRWLSPPEMTFDPLDASPAIVSGWVDRIASFGPCFLYGYGSLLALVARDASRRGLQLPAVRGIASTAEALFASDREMLRRACPGAPIIDIYGSREVPGVAAECSRGTMHLNTDLVDVEFLPDGDAGRHRLVLTSLDNLAFPFLRYDIGDRGEPLDAACGCGLPFPGMRWGIGRVVDLFVTPDGREIYTGPLEELMYGIRGVHRYQFLQETPDRIVVSLVPTEGFDASSRAHLDRVCQRIGILFGPEARFEVRIVPDIPPTRSGKHLYFVSRVRSRQFERNQTEEVG